MTRSEGFSEYTGNIIGDDRPNKTKKEIPDTPEQKKKKELTPEKRYEKGLDHLDFKFQFSGGEELTAKQNEDGTANVELRKNGELIIDFKNWLAKGWKFVTPTFIRDEKYRVDYFTPNWFADPKSKVVNIGYWEGPKNFVYLLHEIGHSHQDWEKIDKLGKAVGPTKEIDLAFMKEQSFLERNAWAFTLQRMRELKKELGIDVISNLFSSLDGLKKLMIFFLHSYAEAYSRKRIVKNDKELEEELGELFDKGLGGEEQKQ